jgi:hypothetical protein
MSSHVSQPQAATVPADGICSCTQEDIKRDYENMKVGDSCPVCKVKIGFHPKAKREFSEGDMKRMLLYYNITSHLEDTIITYTMDDGYYPL